MVRLTEKFFNHSRSIDYRDWNKEPMDILDNHNVRPTCNDSEEEFTFSVNRCLYSIRFSIATGTYTRTVQYFKSTKTNLGDLMMPCIELFADLIANGYMAIEN